MVEAQCLNHGDFVFKVPQKVDCEIMDLGNFYSM